MTSFSKIFPHFVCGSIQATDSCVSYYLDFRSIIFGNTSPNSFGHTSYTGHYCMVKHNMLTKAVQNRRDPLLYTKSFTLVNFEINVLLNHTVRVSCMKSSFSHLVQTVLLFV